MAPGDANFKSSRLTTRVWHTRIISMSVMLAAGMGIDPSVIINAAARGDDLIKTTDQSTSLGSIIWVKVPPLFLTASSRLAGDVYRAAGCACCSGG